MVGGGVSHTDYSSVYNFLQCLTNYTTCNEFRNRGGGTVGQNVGPASGRLSFRIPAATDLSR